MQKTALARNRARTKILLIMRLTVLFIIVGITAVQARAVSQNVTLSGKNISMEVVFEAVKKQTGYVAFGTEGLLVKAKPVTIEAMDMPLTVFLKAVFRNQNLDFEITGKTIVVSSTKSTVEVITEAATDSFYLQHMFRIVTGSIKDEAGKPLAGASIQVAGKNKMTMTDENGRFSLDVEKGDLLEISFVGYEKYTYKVTSVTGEINLSLKIKNDEQQELIISNGFQRISRERASGAFDVVDQKIMKKRPVSNISTALQGLVPGMQAKEQANGNMSFVIRGTGTLGTNNDQPLVVVDGFPIAGADFANINPNDVESVTVLKDAAAASIWGARSANGVIVITTKQAASRAGRNKVNIELNAFSRVSDMIDLNQVMNQASSQQMVSYERMAYERKLFFPQPYGGAFTEIIKPLTLAGEFISANRLGQISAGQMNKSLDSLSTINNQDQFRDLLMRRGMVNQVNLSVSTSGEKTKNYLSVLLENRKEGFKYRGYDRVLLNYSNQYQPASFITFGFGSNIQFRRTTSDGAEVPDLLGLSPYETLLNPDGSYSANIATWNREQLSKLPLQNFPYQDWSYNLLREVNGRDRIREELSARFQATMNLNLAKGLNWDNRFQLERNITEEENYFSDQTFFVRDLVNTMTEYTNSTRVVGRKLLPVGGILQASKRTLQSYVFRSQLGYNHDWAGKHGISAIAGTEITNTKVSGGQNPLLYGYYPEKNQSTVPPYGYGGSLDIFRNFLNQTTTIPGSTPLPEWSLDKFVSFYGNASYTYNNKYTLTASARSDASNYITDDPSLRWSPFWSVGGLWHIYKEKFMLSSKTFDRLSLRVTHGRNGNADKSTSNRPILTVGTSPSANTGTIIGSITDYGNPYLRWEKTVTTNIGLDFAILNNKLNGKVDVYDKKGIDIMGSVQLPGATGVTSQRFNNAEISNRGIEVQLGATIGNSFTYSPLVTYAYNRNKVTRLYLPNLTVSNLIGNSFVEGKPIGATYSFTYLGMIDSLPNIAGVGKVPTSFNTSAVYSAPGQDVLNYEGTTVQPHTLGLVNNFSYRQFNLMVIIVGKFGGIYRNPTFSFSNQTGVGSLKTNLSALVSDVLANDPSIPSFPKYGEPNFYVWDRYTPYLNTLIQSSSYVELKEVNLQYAMPSSLVRRIHLADVSLFANVRDLGLLWKANNKGYHPEWLPGFNRPVTSYTVGLNVKL